MKDQMYLYGFLVMTSIVALILSVISLTKKDKFSDYVNLGVTSPMTDLDIALVNSSPAEQTGVCFLAHPGPRYDPCSAVWGSGGDTGNNTYQMSDDEDMEVVSDVTTGTFKCRSKLKQSLTECCPNQKAAITTFLTSATTGAKPTVQCGSSDTPYKCYYNKGTNVYLCNNKKIPGSALLGECAQHCFTGQAPHPQEVLLTPSEKTTLIKGQFVNFYAKDSDGNKLYLNGYIYGPGLTVVGDNTGADTQWYTEGLYSSPPAGTSGRQSQVFVIIKKGIGAGQGHRSSYLRGQMIAPSRSISNLVCSTNSVRTMILQDFNGTSFTSVPPLSGDHPTYATTRCYNNDNPWPPSRYDPTSAEDQHGNYAWKGDCPADKGYSQPCTYTDYNQNLLKNSTDGDCASHWAHSSTVNYDRYSWDISPDTDGKYYLMISIWADVDKPPTMSSQQWLLVNTITKDVILSPFPPSAKYSKINKYPPDRYNWPNPESWVGFQWYNLSTVPQDMQC